MQTSSNHLFIWAIALIVGLALSVIVLGEIIYRLQHRRRPLAATLQVVRNLVLPMFAFMLFVQYVLQRPASDDIVK
ncbi:MAG: small-conductance mechanosensitive channel, partial [Pseudanabaena sp.]